MTSPRLSEQEELVDRGKRFLRAHGAHLSGATGYSCAVELEDVIIIGDDASVFAVHLKSCHGGFGPLVYEERYSNAVFYKPSCASRVLQTLRMHMVLDDLASI